MPDWCSLELKVPVHVAIRTPKVVAVVSGSRISDHVGSTSFSTDRVEGGRLPARRISALIPNAASTREVEHPNSDPSAVSRNERKMPIDDSDTDQNEFKEHRPFHNHDSCQHGLCHAFITCGQRMHCRALCVCGEDDHCAKHASLAGM